MKNFKEWLVEQQIAEEIGIINVDPTSDVYQIAYEHAQKMGYVVDESDVAQIVYDAVTPNSESKTIEFKVPMLSVASPDGEPVGYLTFNYSP